MGKFNPTPIKSTLVFPIRSKLFARRLLGNIENISDMIG